MGEVIDNLALLVEDHTGQDFKARSQPSSYGPLLVVPETIP